MPGLADDPRLIQARGALHAGDGPRARMLCEALIRDHPSQADLHATLGALSAQGAGLPGGRPDLHHALACLRRATRLEPRNAEFLRRFGGLCLELSLPTEAEQAYRQALDVDPRNAEALLGHARSLWLLSVSRPLLRRASLDRLVQAVEIDPDFDPAHLELAVSSLALDDANLAIRHARRALALRPSVEALTVLAEAHSRLGETAEALGLLGQARALDPLQPHLLAATARALCELDKPQEALPLALQACEADPDSLPFLETLVDAQERVGDAAGALRSLERRLMHGPSAEAHFRAAANHLARADTAAARTSLRLALATFQPGQGEELPQAAVVAYLDRFSRDWAALNRAVDFLWENLEADESIDVGHALPGILNGVLGVTGRVCPRALSFERSPKEHFSAHLLSLHYVDGMDPVEIFGWHRRFGEWLEARVPPMPGRPRVKVQPDRLLRVAYLSADLRQHSVAHFIESVLEHHDPRQVQVLGYYNEDVEDETTRRIRRLCSAGWRSIRGMSDEAVCQALRSDKVDILVDLMGHTGNYRIGVLAARPAPLQMVYLGYPDTTGLSRIDYRITDAHVEPEGAEALSTEPLIRLPGSYFCYRPSEASRGIEVSPLPALDRGHITFGSFNAITKVTDAQLRLWARLLDAVPGSRLLLKLRLSGGRVRNFRGQVLSRLASQGIAAHRVILRDYAHSVEVALSAYHDVDIALDTFPYHGATTTCESLWMGCPVLTRAGSHHVSRMGLSILSAAGLADWVAGDAQDLIDRAARFCADPAALAALRAGLRQRMQASALMDGATFTRTLEQAYRSAWQRWCASQRTGAAA